jgi:hypothetical protein
LSAAAAPGPRARHDFMQVGLHIRGSWRQHEDDTRGKTRKQAATLAMSGLRSRGALLGHCTRLQQTAERASGRRKSVRPRPRVSARGLHAIGQCGRLGLRFPGLTLTATAGCGPTAPSSTQYLMGNKEGGMSTAVLKADFLSSRSARVGAISAPAWEGYLGGEADERDLALNPNPDPNPNTLTP